jgi:hypothetical protein
MPKYVAPMSDVGSRFRDAIRRRAHPNTALHLQQIAGICGYSRNSFMRWWRGEARIPLEAMDALVKFFDSAGDRAFQFEVFGQEIAAAQAELDALKLRIAALQSRGFGHASADRTGVDDDAETAAAGGAADFESRAAREAGRVVGHAGAPLVRRLAQVRR